MPFSKLIKNDLAKSALQRMVSQSSVPNTLLFYGPDGVGKGLFAIALAELLMGPRHASKLASRNHPDLHIYKPEGKSSIHTVETIRKLIEETSLPPYEAPVKVFILHDAHQMLPYSSNALLKTLEEPPFHCYFILLTSSLDSILPTIASRCRKVPFFPIPQPDIEAFIKDKWGKKPDEARRVAFLSHGSLAKAKQLLENAQLAWRHPLLEILSLNLPSDYAQFQRLLLELEKSSSLEEKEDEAPPIDSDAILEEIVAWYRDLHLLKEQVAPEYLYHLDSMDRLKLALSSPIPPLEKVLDKIGQAHLALQRNVSLRSALDHFFLST